MTTIALLYLSTGKSVFVIHTYPQISVSNELFRVDRYNTTVTSLVRQSCLFRYLYLILCVTDYPIRNVNPLSVTSNKIKQNYIRGY